MRIGIVQKGGQKDPLLIRGQFWILILLLLLYLQRLNHYGDLNRFKSIINSFPLEYKKLLPLEKMLTKKNNPPEFVVEFFKDQKNLENINCYSNEGDKWKKSKTNILNNTLTIQFRTVFKPRRGRINCSLNDNGKWRWFGVQFPIKEN